MDQICITYFFNKHLVIGTPAIIHFNLLCLLNGAISEQTLSCIYSEGYKSMTCQYAKRISHDTQVFTSSARKWIEYVGVTSKYARF